MAWNEPDNKGSDKNPWGRRARQDGQSVDEAFRNFQRKLESLLGGGRGGGAGGRGGAGPGDKFIPLLVGALVLLVWLGSGFYQVEAAEQGVIQRFGKFVGTRGPGWGWRLPFPIESVTKVNIAGVNKVEYKSRVLTADLNLVDMTLTVQYQLRDPVRYLFKVRDPQATLQEVSESAIREVVGRSSLEGVVLSGRQQLTDRTRDLIQRTLDQYEAGIHVTTVNLTEVQVPDAVIPSQRDANKAIADRDRFKKEAEAYASGILPVAEGDALRQIQEAEGYKSQVTATAEGEAARFIQVADAYAAAPQVTRQRLFIEAVESFLGRSNKVILDSKGAGGGNMIYLPLDKLLERSGRAVPADTSRPAPRTGAEGIAESGVPDPRTRGDR
jgi:membrane protease subunit HflK